MDVHDYVELLLIDSNYLNNKINNDIAIVSYYYQRKSDNLFFDIYQQHGTVFLLSLKKAIHNKEILSKLYQGRVNFFYLISAQIDSLLNNEDSPYAKKELSDFHLYFNQSCSRRIVQFQEIENIKKLFPPFAQIEHIGYKDFLSSLLSEIICRKEPSISKYFEIYFNEFLSDYWLNKLPYYRLSVEKSITLINDNKDGSGYSDSSFNFSKIHSDIIKISPKPLVSLQEFYCLPHFNQAVIEWSRVVCKTFNFYSDINNDFYLISSTLKSIESITGKKCQSAFYEKIKKQKYYNVKKIELSDLMALFFSASGGGAYTKTSSDFKTRRLLAWQSYTGFLNRDINFLMSNNKVSDISVFTIEPNNRWFSHIAWDLYIIVIDYKMPEIRVLLATASD